MRGHRTGAKLTAVPGRLFVDGVSPHDVMQGRSADCYFLGSLAAVADADPRAVRDAISAREDGAGAADGERYRELSVRRSSPDALQLVIRGTRAAVPLDTWEQRYDEPGEIPVPLGGVDLEKPPRAPTPRRADFTM